MKAIRLATLLDAWEIANIYGPYVAKSAISFEQTPPTEAELKERIQAILPGFPWLVLTQDGQILGYAYASRHGDRQAYLWSVNTAIYVREDSYRQGIGRALYTSLIACLKIQGFHAAHAGATLPNAGSVGLHESMGYRKIGIYPKVGFKSGKWHDVIWWQFPLRERMEAPPAAPQTLAMAQLDPRWVAALQSGLAPA